MQPKWLTVFLAKHGEKKYHFSYNRNALLKIQIMTVEFGEVLNSSRGGGGGGYRKIAVRGPNNRRKYFIVHRLVYMIFHELSVIPSCNDEGISVEISHICHHKLCVKPQLVLETHDVNMGRLHCKNQGFCSRGHQPHCLLNCEFSDYVLNYFTDLELRFSTDIG